MKANKARRAIYLENRRALDLIHDADVLYTLADPEGEFGQDFAEAFDWQLKMAHYMNRSVMQGKGFEGALAFAFSASGRKASVMHSDTHPYDLLLEDPNERIASKSETRSKINPDFLHISKLVSLGAAKGVRTRAGAAALIPHIIVKLDDCDRMFTLRAFNTPEAEMGRHVRYELVEIPKDVFASLAALEASDFSRVTQGARSTADLKNAAGEVIAKLILDGSGGKVTIERLRADACQTVATFWVPYGDDLVAARTAAA